MHDPTWGVGFLAGCSTHRDEFCVGGVHIRVYNAQATFPLEDPADFLRSAVRWLSELGLAALAGAGDYGGAQPRVLALVTAMRNALTAHVGVEVVLKPHFPVLCQMLRGSSEAVAMMFLEV